jgi:hypothetical protein
MGLASRAEASPILAFGAAITFDQTGAGAGGSVVVDTFNFLPGNALAIGAVPAYSDFVNSGGTILTPFDSILQTSVGSIQDVAGSGVPIALNAGSEITMVLRTKQLPSTATTSVFSPGAPNFLNLYYDLTPDANNLSGAGFNDGTLILSAAITTLGSTVVAGGPAGPLDGNGSDDYFPVTTLGLAGTANFTATVLFFDPDFFLTQPNAVLFTTALIAPFPGGVGGIDPSATLDGTLVNTGPVNGLSGPDILFRSQSELTFAVPEPSTITLLAVGALCLVGFGLPGVVGRRKSGGQTQDSGS